MGTDIIKKRFSGTTLKYIAITAMLIDHIAWAFVSDNSTLGQIMHTIGRLTAPIMCYLIAEGYHHTKNIKKYLLRMGIFAVISAFAFTFNHTGSPFKFYYLGVIYTLFLGLVSLIVWDSELHKHIKIILTILICLLSVIGDWQVFGVLFVLAFGRNYGNIKKQIMYFCVVVVSMMTIIIIGEIFANHQWYFQLYNFALLLAIPLILSYNGKRGAGGAFNKWVFYIFYPLHLVVIGIIKFYIIK